MSRETQSDAGSSAVARGLGSPGGIPAPTAPRVGVHPGPGPGKGQLEAQSSHSAGQARGDRARRAPKPPRPGRALTRCRRRRRRRLPRTRAPPLAQLTGPHAVSRPAACRAVAGAAPPAHHVTRSRPRVARLAAAAGSAGPYWPGGGTRAGAPRLHKRRRVSGAKVPELVT